MDMVKIGGFLATLRHENKLTQEQLGERLGVSNKTISRWETGNYLPPVEMLQLMSGIYGVSINEILSGERLTTEQYREKAEENLSEAVAQSCFSAKEKAEYYRKKWKKEHWFSFVFPTIIAVAVIIVSAIFDQKLGIALGCLIPIPAKIIAYNQMMAYIEKHAYDGSGTDFTKSKE